MSLVCMWHLQISLYFCSHNGGQFLLLHPKKVVRSRSFQVLFQQSLPTTEFPWMTRVGLSERIWGTKGWDRQSVGRGQRRNLRELPQRIITLGQRNFKSSRKVEQAGPLMGIIMGWAEGVLTPDTPTPGLDKDLLCSQFARRHQKCHLQGRLGWWT